MFVPFTLASSCISSGYFENCCGTVCKVLVVNEVCCVDLMFTCFKACDIESGNMAAYICIQVFAVNVKKDYACCIAFIECYCNMFDFTYFLDSGTLMTNEIGFFTTVKRECAEDSSYQWFP